MRKFPEISGKHYINLHRMLEINLGFRENRCWISKKDSVKGFYEGNPSVPRKNDRTLE